MPSELASIAGSRGEPGSIDRTAPPVQAIEASPIALFAGMSPRESRAALSAATQLSFASNEAIFLEGYPANCLILIETGRVKLGLVGRDGSEVILRICHAGEVADVYAESVYSHHTCSARALAPCNVRVWDSKQAFALGMLYPQIRTNLTRILANRLEELEERFCEIAIGNCCQRLARALLTLVEPRGRSNRHGNRVLLSRAELAQMIGATRFTISRTLSKWAETGIVSPRRNAIVVQRPGELKKLLDAGLCSLGKRGSKLTVCREKELQKAGKANYRKFPEAYRELAVRRMKECVNVSGLCRELGISRQVLYQWRDRFERQHQPHESAKAGKRQLQKEDAQPPKALSEKTPQGIQQWRDFQSGRCLK